MIATELPRQGRLLFRHRSYLPILMVVPIALPLLRPDRAAHLSPTHEWWAMACLAVSMTGLVMRALTVGFVPRGTSGRNTREQRAERLNTSGLYSVVRHPLYVANFVIWLGIIFAVADLAVTLMFISLYWLYYERIMAAEESFLASRFGAAYTTWAERTPALIPRWSRWRRPDLTFSLRTVLRREYCGLLGITVGFAALDAARHLASEQRLYIEPVWRIVFAIGLIGFVTLRFLKKRTRLLHVDGR